MYARKKLSTLCASTVQPRHICSPITVYPDHVFCLVLPTQMVPRHDSRRCFDMGPLLPRMTTFYWFAVVPLCLMVLLLKRSAPLLAHGIAVTVACPCRPRVV